MNDNTMNDLGARVGRSTPVCEQQQCIDVTGVTDVIYTRRHIIMPSTEELLSS